jgi:hypothetical protein
MIFLYKIPYANIYGIVIYKDLYIETDNRPLSFSELLVVLGNLDQRQDHIGYVDCYDACMETMKAIGSMPHWQMHPRYSYIMFEHLGKHYPMSVSQIPVISASECGLH